MKYEVTHIPERNLFIAEVDGETAFVEYDITDEHLDILHTIVPGAISGRGVASELVETAYNYAVDNNLKPKATCTYAVAWLERHPDYQS